MTVTDEEVEAAVNTFWEMWDKGDLKSPDIIRAALEAAARVREQHDRDMERG